MPRHLATTLKPRQIGQRGQSLVEFALSSVVLLLLVGGLVDIGRAIFITEIMSSAAREGARHAAWFDAPNLSHPYLSAAQVKIAVDQELTASSLPASILRAGCPTVADGNAYENPPYTSSMYPAAVNQAWLYVCFNNSSGSPGAGGAQDINVVVLYSYAPLTPALGGQFGTFRLAANEHMTEQGP